MSNPWLDPAFAARFRREANPWNPTRPEQVEILLHLIGASRPRRVLDAGCGPGFLAEAILDAFPGTEVVGFDFSEEMVAQASQRLGGRARFLRLDLEGDWSEAGTGYDLVLAAQCVHHLRDESKRAVFERVHACLARGGLFLQSDPVALRDDALFPLQVALWDRARDSAGFGPLEPGFDHRAFSMRLEAYGDHLTPLDVQLRWLEEIGFVAVTCFWLHGNRAIFGGVRPA